jgi:hypothetical protein
MIFIAAAAALVLAAFCMREMVALCLAALCSNLAFIAYGLALGLTPVWLLHALLLPMNDYRLLEVLRARRISVSRKIEVVRLGARHLPWALAIRGVRGRCRHDAGAHLSRSGATAGTTR